MQRPKPRKTALKLAETQQKANETVQEAIESGDRTKSRKHKDRPKQFRKSPLFPHQLLPLAKNSVGSGSSRLVYKADW